MLTRCKLVKSAASQDNFLLSTGWEGFVLELPWLPRELRPPPPPQLCWAPTWPQAPPPVAVIMATELGALNGSQAQARARRRHGPGGSQGLLEFMLTTLGSRCLRSSAKVSQLGVEGLVGLFRQVPAGGHTQGLSSTDSIPLQTPRAGWGLLGGGNRGFLRLLFL